LQILKDDAQGQATHYDGRFVWQALGDYKTYIFALMFVGYV
jgi:hypothetical protein